VVAVVNTCKILPNTCKKGRRKAIAETGLQFTSSAVPQNERGKERKKRSKKGRRKAIAETGVQFTSSAVPQITNGWG
jgi:hypothetical protein